MPEVTKKAPVIRFKGFSDAWEQRKLREVGNVVTGSTPSTLDKTNYNGSYLFVSPADIQGNRYVDKTITTLSEKGFRKGRILKEGAILFVSIGSTIGKVAQIRQEAVTNQQINAVVPHEDYDDNFIFSSLVKESEKIKLLSATQAVPIINKTTFSNIDIHIPGNIKEQIQIGAFFNKMDDTIALHQRKSTLLKQLKQTYLKQIFPQNKENIPALRFAGFSEPWKQHKFDEVFSHVQNNSLSRADLNYNGGYAMNIHYGDILIRFGEYLDVSKCKLPMIANKQLVEKYKASFLKDGDIVIADAAEDETVGKCSELRGIEDAKILAGLHTIPSRPNWTFAPGYLGYYMNSSAFHDQLLPLIQGTKISSISKSALKKTDIKYPYGKDEQTKIGNLFKQLDDSISLHQSKLEKLTDLKQVLLAKMFV